VPGVTQKQQPGPALMGSQMHLPDLAVTKPCGGGRVRALVTAGLSAVHAGTRARTHDPLEAPSVVEHTARPQPQQQRHSQVPGAQNRKDRPAAAAHVMISSWGKHIPLLQRLAGVRKRGCRGRGLRTALQTKQTLDVEQTTQLGSKSKHAAAAAFACAYRRMLVQCQQDLQWITRCPFPIIIIMSRVQWRFMIRALSGRSLHCAWPHCHATPQLCGPACSACRASHGSQGASVPPCEADRRKSTRPPPAVPGPPLLGPGARGAPR